MTTSQISIPTTTLHPPPAPYTLYNILIPHPLHPTHLPKRYSDFPPLHSALLAQTSSPPPLPLPPKTFPLLTSTTSPTFIETRRLALEAYLRAIHTDPDPRWRDTSAWRGFLNLPPASSTGNSSRSTLNGGAAAATGAGVGNVVTTDPSLWLSHHKAAKTQLHTARLALTKRDQQQSSSSSSSAGGENTVVAQYEAAAQAKKALVRAGTLIAGLEKGLDGMKKGVLGEGEMRRRRDMLGMLRREREGLERVEGLLGVKAGLDQKLSGGNNAGDDSRKRELLSSSPSKTSRTTAGGGRERAGGRVLGKETGRTQPLDNQGVLGLQRQMMQEQDEDLVGLGEVVRRQKELGVQIQEELELQGEMLGMVAEDVDRVEGKLGVARKRVKEIS